MTQTKHAIYHRNHPIKTRLSNGLTVIYLHTKNDPVSAGHFFFPGGFVDETHKTHGATNLLMSCLLRGTKNRTAKSLAEEIESVGAHIGAGASHDYATVSFYSLAEYFPKILGIVEDILFNFQAPYEEIQKEQQAEIAGIKAKKENIFVLTQEEMFKRFYKGHPYSHPISGYPDTVGALRRDMLDQWRQRLFAPNNAVLTLASNERFEKFLPKIESMFGPNRWEVVDLGWKRRPTPPIPEESRKANVTSRFEQAFLLEAFPAPPVGSPDFAAFKVMASLLGGGMGARLFQSLREEKGLAYDVGAYYPTRADFSGLFVYLGLQPNRMSEAVHGIRTEINRLKTEMVPDAELEQIKNYISGSYLLDHQTNSSKAHYLGWWEINGVSSNFDEDYLSEIAKVTSQDIQRLANTYLENDPWVVETLPGAGKNGTEQEA